jgi:hypothetical protein
MVLEGALLTIKRIEKYDFYMAKEYRWKPASDHRVRGQYELVEAEPYISPRVAADRRIASRSAGWEYAKSYGKTHGRVNPNTEPIPSGVEQRPPELPFGLIPFYFWKGYKHYFAVHSFTNFVARHRLGFGLFGVGLLAFSGAVYKSAREYQPKVVAINTPPGAQASKGPQDSLPLSPLAMNQVRVHISRNGQCTFSPDRVNIKPGESIDLETDKPIEYVFDQTWFGVDFLKSSSQIGGAPITKVQFVGSSERIRGINSPRIFCLGNTGDDVHGSLQLNFG